jgi:superfamily II helicase
MDAKITEFTQLIDQAIDSAEQIDQEEQSDRLDNLIAVLKKLKKTATAGQLEPSHGTATLGLAREVADWIESLDSPLLSAVGAVEDYYQKHL